jgi:hypothetical protein
MKKKENKSKKCNKCGKESGIGDFYIQRHKKFSVKTGTRIVEYVSSYCKKCDREMSHKYSSINRKAINTAKRDRLKSDPVYRNIVNKSKRDSCANNVEQGMVTRARQRARKKLLPFNITKHDVVIPSHCPLLGIKLVRGTKGNYDASPSLDRKDPKLGYTVNNIWVISNRANTMKSNATLAELTTFYNNIMTKMI